MGKQRVEQMGEPEVVGEALRRDGKRMTAQRALLLHIIADSDEHLDADEIYRRARERGAKLSLSTVYRTLAMLAEMGFLRELDLNERHHYERALGEHYHLFCLQCGRVVEYWPPDGGRALHQAAQQRGFELIRTRLELHGLCDRCRARLAKQDGGEGAG